VLVSRGGLVPDPCLMMVSSRSGKCGECYIIPTTMQW
jgi:hypothetical protein